MSTSSPAFRDSWDAAWVEQLARRLPLVDSAVRPSPRDVRAVAASLDPLPMKARVVAIADAIEEWGRPRSPAAWCTFAVDLVEQDPPWTGFHVWPAALLVERHGPAAPAAALDALEAITQRFTGEFAIRPLLLACPDQVWPRLHAWCEHPSEHVRRLVSEGTRTRLPWGQRLQPLIDDPSPLWPLLERLRDDPSPYVRRSVSNHLNDLSRDHPEAVVATAQRWADGAPAERVALLRHALRTLVKQGHSGALAVLGYGAAALSVDRFEVHPARIPIGASVRWTATLTAQDRSRGAAVVDIAVHFVRARGKTSRKVFKGANVSPAPGETLDLSRSLPFRQVSVRRLYPGPHRIDLLVDGEPRATAHVELTDELP